MSRDGQKRILATTGVGLAGEMVAVVEAADAPLRAEVGPAADTVESDWSVPNFAVVAAIPIVFGFVVAVPNVEAAEESMVVLVPSYAAAAGTWCFEAVPGSAKGSLVMSDGTWAPSHGMVELPHSSPRGVETLPVLKDVAPVAR